MAIDPLNEQLISLSEAAKQHFPKSGRGKCVHLSSVYRYTKSGCRGVILESLQAGSTRCTSREAISRFFQRLTERTVPQTQPDPTEYQRTADRAGEILDATFFKTSRRRSSNAGQNQE